MTYRVRNLYCISCDESVRVRNQIVDDCEVPSPCSECGGGLVDIGRVNLKWPETQQIRPEVIGGVISITFTDPWQS
jgi:hypothetical protein